jgi:hypothetical protein
MATPTPSSMQMVVVRILTPECPMIPYRSKAEARLMFREVFTARHNIALAGAPLARSYKENLNG